MNRDYEFEQGLGFSGSALAAAGVGQGAEGQALDADRPSEGPPMEGVVKWFRSDKGYGFVALGGGTGDAFLHLKALKAFGRDSAAPGARVSVVVGEGPRGLQVTRVVDIDETFIQPAGAPPCEARGNRRADRDVSSAIDLTGRVKWFDDVRGFGFVASDDFGRDVFFHCSVLGPSGVSRLDQGQPVAMRVIETPKGREAVQISL